MTIMVKYFFGLPPPDHVYKSLINRHFACRINIIQHIVNF